MKVQSLGFGMAMGGKKGASALDKLFPGRRRGELERVSAEENPLGIAAEALPDESAAYSEGEQDDFLASVAANYGHQD